MRTTALLLLLCACNTLSPDQLDQLEACQQRAPIYFEGGKLEQALEQAERGLAIDPDDYKLNAIKGAVLLRASNNNPKLLDRSSRILERIYDWRSPMRHEPYVLLYYALAEQKHGLRNLGDAIRKEDEATRAPERKVELSEEARQLREQADEKLAHADELLGYLVDRGELLRVVYKHRLQIARQRGKDDRFLTAVEKFLLKSADEQKEVRKQIETTEVAAFEGERLTFLEALKEEELEVRALFADWYYQRDKFSEALEQLNAVLVLDPKRSNDYYNRGRVLLELGRVDAAKDDFRRFLALTQLPPTSEKITFASQALRQ